MAGVGGDDGLDACQIGALLAVEDLGLEGRSCRSLWGTWIRVRM
jgi:hypothetical protein